MSDASEATTEPAAEATPKSGRRPRYRANQRITILTRDTHLREGKINHRHFEALLNLPQPITAGAAKSVGVPYAYLDFFQKRGYIRVEPADAGD